MNRGLPYTNTKDKAIPWSSNESYETTASISEQAKKLNKSVVFGSVENHPYTLSMWFLQRNSLMFDESNGYTKIDPLWFLILMVGNHVTPLSSKHSLYDTRVY